MRQFWFKWSGWKHFAYDFFIIQIGFALFGVAIDIIVKASIGLDSWDVFQMALTYHAPITLGESSIGVALIVVLFDLLLGERLGWGTIANAVFIGIWVDLLRPYTPAVPALIPLQIVYLLLGTFIMGFATAIYIGVDAGAGPRDTLMLGLSRVGGVSVRIARTCIEITVVVLGWLLGGPVWLGTLVAAFAIGPAVQFAFKVLGIHPKLLHTSSETTVHP
jgi:uncharacterized membrane protein YczE